jgi:2-(1,2-epoxy-1,2-dihydrophenyl)acetyl-CoA isomerase
MNALNIATKNGLLEAMRAVQADPAVRAVVLTGAGRAFCVGQDLREFADQHEAGDVDSVFSTVREHFSPLSEIIATMGKPVVAAVNGPAAGAGMSLALAADFRIASSSASFTTAFTAIGLTPDTGMSYYLPRIVGAAKAVELLMLSPTLTAEESLRLGLVMAVTGPADLMAAAAQLAERLAEGPTEAYALVRGLLRASWAGSLRDALAAEDAAIHRVGATRDHAAAVAAFLKKERPLFQGR